MKNIKKTKIVATLGPASSTKEVIRDMIIAGVNVFRINFSHASYDDVRERIQYIRELNDELGFNVAILADLQGPKLRVGNMEDGVVVSPGDKITFTTNKIELGNANQVYMNYKRFPKDVKKGERILLDDGKLIFEV
jgi:pyruvate kinase